MTWNIHGRKQIVWRCISRLEFGKKFCKDSPSIPEDALHKAIVAGLNTLLSSHQEEVTACIQNTLVNCAVTETGTDPIAIQNKIAEMNREFDRLLLLAGDEENKFLDRKLQQINDELLSLKQLKKRTEQAIEQNKNRISVQDGICQGVFLQKLQIVQ